VIIKVIKQAIDKFKSTKLVKNIRELQAREYESKLAQLIYQVLDGYIDKEVNRYYITAKIMSIIRLYKF
jgi:hypothetical protein